MSTKLGSRYAISRDDTTQAAGTRGGGARALDELKRSLTQMFGDGQGYVPDGAYVDMMHVHNLNTETAGDVVFEGLDNPGDKSLPRVGTLALLVDYRDGTNLTGLNPDHKKWIRHIAMSCHENPTSVMYAMRKDKNNIFEGLMCTINPNDPGYFSFENNAMPVAQAKNVGVMAMKVFSDGVFWGKGEHWGGERIKTIGLNPFGGAPFGEGPFGPHEEEEEEAADTTGQTILQRHKVDVAISHKRWLQLRGEWKRARQEVERKRRRPAKEEADAQAKRKREAVAYAAEVAHRNSLAATNEQLSFWLAEAQRQYALEQAQSQFLTMAAERHQRALAAAAMQVEMGARYRMAIADQQEEEEVLELLMAA